MHSILSLVKTADDILNPAALVCKTPCLIMLRSLSITNVCIAFDEALHATSVFKLSSEVAKNTRPAFQTDSILKIPTFSCCMVQTFFDCFKVKLSSSTKARYKLNVVLLSL